MAVPWLKLSAGRVSASDKIFGPGPGYKLWPQPRRGHCHGKVFWPRPRQTLFLILRYFYQFSKFSNSANLSALFVKFWKIISVNIIFAGDNLLGLPEVCFHYTSEGVCLSVFLSVCLSVCPHKWNSALQNFPCSKIGAAKTHTRNYSIFNQVRTNRVLVNLSLFWIVDCI